MENLNSSLNDWILGRPLNVKCSREVVGKAACCLTGRASASKCLSLQVPTQVEPAAKGKAAKSA